MEKVEYVVYLHQNKINGKCYVGQTDNIKRRWRSNGAEYYDHRKKDEEQPIFWKAIQKYGWDNFEHIILKKHLSLEEADYWEQYYIDYYHSRYNENGYNIREGGSHGALAESTKEKLSQIQKAKGQWQGDKNPRHIDPLCGERNPMYGKQHTEEAKKKMSEAHKGKPLTEEHKEKIKNFMNTKHPRARKVRCIETGEEFLSARKACEAYDLSHNAISRVCNGERKTAKGLHWEWVDNE